jgi:hypothetical protein
MKLTSLNRLVRTALVVAVVVATGVLLVDTGPPATALHRVEAVT